MKTEFLRSGIFPPSGMHTPSLKSVTHILRSKKYMNHVTHSLSPADIRIFHWRSANVAILF